MPRLLLLALLLFVVGCGNDYHPAGFDDASVHGEQLRLQQDDCRACHGDQLDGQGSADVSCDSCHRPDWRTDCTYCHGGEETDTGAPPRDLDGTVGADATSFPPHTVHTTETIHAARECSMCHVQPDDVLSVGHVFDSSPAVAEVDFSGGLADGADWGGIGCSNNYCHGNGREGGDVEVNDEVGCGDCHVGPDASPQEANQLSGEHREHIAHNVECLACHPVVNAAGEITDPARHVDGEDTLEMPYGVTRDGNGRCTGECHNENHDNDSW